MPARKRILSTFLRTFFRLLYHQFSWSYDLVAATVSRGRWKAWVQSTLPYLTGPAILELGHGPGHLQLAMHRRFIHSDNIICGLDESKWMGSLAYRRIKREGFNPSLVNGYAQFMPFSNSSFHQIVSTFPSDYISDPKTLAEISRLLLPGGELIILPAAWITGVHWYDRLAAWLFRVTGQVPSGSQELDDKAIAAPYEKAGFEVQVERIQLPSSLVLLIRARRRAGSQIGWEVVHEQLPSPPPPME